MLDIDDLLIKIKEGYTMIGCKTIMIPVRRDTEEMLSKARGSYATKPEGDDEYKWIPNHLWPDTIVVTDFQRGNRSVHFIVKSEVTGKEYIMFMSDMRDMIKEHTLEKGKVSGCFTYVKRGNHYGIKIC